MQAQLGRRPGLLRALRRLLQLAVPTAVAADQARSIYVTYELAQQRFAVSALLRRYGGDELGQGATQESSLGAAQEQALPGLGVDVHPAAAPVC